MAIWSCDWWSWPSNKCAHESLLLFSTSISKLHISLFEAFTCVMKTPACRTSCESMGDKTSQTTLTFTLRPWPLTFVTLTLNFMSLTYDICHWPTALSLTPVTDRQTHAHGTINITSTSSANGGKIGTLNFSKRFNIVSLFMCYTWIDLNVAVHRG